MKKLFSFIIILSLILTGCSSTKSYSKPPDTKKSDEVSLDIMTTNKMVYYIVKDIVKDKHNVQYMFKNYDDMYNFSFTDDSIYNIGNQDLFLYVGADFEPWADDFTKKVGNSKASLINVSRGINLLSLSKPLNFNNYVINYNSYYYLDVDNYKMMLLNIKNSIEDKDPKSTNFYENNFNNILKTVDGYKKDLKSISDAFKDYTFIVDGDDLDYFTKYMNFKTVKIDSTANDKDYESKNEKKFENSPKTVYLYSDPDRFKIDNEFLSKDKIPAVSIEVYEDNAKYDNIINYNISSLKKLITNIKNE